MHLRDFGQLQIWRDVPTDNVVMPAKFEVCG